MSTQENQEQTQPPQPNEANEVARNIAEMVVFLEQLRNDIMQGHITTIAVAALGRNGEVAGNVRGFYLPAPTLGALDLLKEQIMRGIGFEPAEKPGEPEKGDG